MPEEEMDCTAFRTVVVTAILFFGGLLLLSFAGYLYIGHEFSYSWTDLGAGKENAREVIMALDQPYQEEGEYPWVVEELIPGFLAQMPMAPHSQPYVYRPCDGGDWYVLHFYLPAVFPHHAGYSSESRTWAVTDGTPYSHLYP